MISSARLAILVLVPACGTPAFRPLIPGATSSSPLLIDPPTPSSESWSAEGGHARSDKELRAAAEQTCSADNAPNRKGYGFIELSDGPATLFSMRPRSPASASAP